MNTEGNAVGDGDVIVGEGFTFEALHTPGHISNHLCFSLEEESTLFTGDHVMGWSTTVIPAPDGNLSHYLSNLRRLLAVCDVTVLIYTFVFFFDIFHLLTNKLRLKAAFHVHVHIRVDV